MKIWNSYGSEHSSNILVIGRFKTESDATKAEKLIDELTALTSEKVDYSGRGRSRFPESIWEDIRKLQCHFLSPVDLDDFIYDGYTSRENEIITVSTKEYDINAFLKVMVHHGARVEVFSRDDYPEQEG